VGLVIYHIKLDTLYIIYIFTQGYEFVLCFLLHYYFKHNSIFTAIQKCYYIFSHALVTASSDWFVTHFWNINLHLSNKIYKKIKICKIIKEKILQMRF